VVAQAVAQEWLLHASKFSCDRGSPADEGIVERAEMDGLLEAALNSFESRRFLKAESDKCATRCL
jgi:hypothetical protein